jgi:hypothetical protein
VACISVIGILIVWEMIRIGFNESSESRTRFKRINSFLSSVINLKTWSERIQESLLVKPNFFPGTYLTFNQYSRGARTHTFARCFLSVSRRWRACERSQDVSNCLRVVATCYGEMRTATVTSRWASYERNFTGQKSNACSATQRSQQPIKTIKVLFLPIISESLSAIYE